MLIIMIILLYLMDLLFLIDLKLIGNVNDSIVLAIFIIGLVLGGIGILFGIANGLFELLNIFNSKKNSIKKTFVIKIVLIPWYILNFFFWFLIAAGFCNPWLMLAVPIVIALGVGFTEFIMLLTSVDNIIYVIKVIIKKKAMVSKTTILAFVLHFVLCLDVIGAIMLLYKQNKNTL